MSGGFVQQAIQCPFYKWDDARRRVVCESPVDDDGSISLTFKRQHDAANFIAATCCDNYKECRIYKAIMEKYPDGDGK